MKKAIFFLFIVVTLGCNSKDNNKDNYTNPYCENLEGTKLLIYDDLERSYFVFAPDNLSGTPLPVILNFHGYGGTIDDYVEEADLRELVNAKNIIVVYPQGSCLEGVPHWNAALPGPDNKSTADDLGFVEALINQLNIDYLIDQDRIYACGFSNGGMMAYALACYRSDLIAAIGSISGVMLDTSGSCTPNRAVPVIKLHGTADPVLPFNGDVNWNSAQSAIDFWVTNNQTNTTPEESTYNNIERYHYTEGNNGTAVDFYKIINGEHFWFNLEVEGQNTANILWQFFDLYDLNGLR